MKNSFAFCAAGILPALLLSGCFFVLGDAVDLPPEPEPQVVLGGEQMHKSVLLDDTRLGTVTDIRVFPQEAPERFVGIAAENGVLFLDQSGKPSEFVPLAEAGQQVEFIRPETGSRAGFIGVSTWHNARVFDGTGKALWTVENFMGVDDLAAGDVDGDGDLEFVAGFNGGGGLRLYDHTGTERWKMREGNVWHVELVDMDGDGRDEIVHSNAGGEMTFRDGGGGVVKRGNPLGYFSQFSRCVWPDPAGKPHLLSAEDGTIQVYDAAGGVAASFDAPMAGSLGDAYGTPIVFEGDSSPHFAVVVELRDRSILYLYKDQDTLIYQEILPEPTSAIAAVTLEGRGVTLLVGGRNKVLLFRLKQ